MLGLWKREYSSDQAVSEYIAHIAKQSETSFNPWLQQFLQGTVVARCPCPSDKIAEIINGRDAKMVYSTRLIHFAALCALDAVAIRNLFSAGESSAIYESLRRQLGTAIKGKDKLPDIVFHFLGDLEKDVSADAPFHSLVRSVLEMMGFDEQSETRMLFDSYLFAMFVTQGFVDSRAIGWWKSFSQKSKLKI